MATLFGRFAGFAQGETKALSMSLHQTILTTYQIYWLIFFLNFILKKFISVQDIDTSINSVTFNNTSFISRTNAS